MTDKEKAREIARGHANFCYADAVSAADRMAEWKNNQFIEFLENERERYNAEAERCEDQTTKKFWVSKAAALDVTVEKFRDTL